MKQCEFETSNKPDFTLTVQVENIRLQQTAKNRKIMN